MYLTSPPISFILNYKRIPYTTVWMTYSEIASTIKGLGAASSGTLPDGAARYTVPTIVDDGKVVTDSWIIAQYLEEKYPEPAIFPPGTLGLQAFFDAHIGGPTGIVVPFGPAILPSSRLVMDPHDAEYFSGVWSKVLGAPLEELWNTEEKRTTGRKAIDAALDTVDKVYQSAEGAIFLGGDTPLYVDFVVAGCFIPVKYGKPDEWERISKLNGGRWVRMLDAVQPYMQVEFP